MMTSALPLLAPGVLPGTALPLQFRQDMAPHQGAIWAERASVAALLIAFLSLVVLVAGGSGASGRWSVGDIRLFEIAIRLSRLQ